VQAIEGKILRGKRKRGVEFNCNIGGIENYHGKCDKLLGNKRGDWTHQGGTRNSHQRVL